MRFLLFILLFLSVSINSEEKLEEDILLYRKSIREHQFDKAESILRKLGNDGLSIPNLELLETEFWIEKGEYLYQNKQFKSAFPFFKDAYLRWRTNQLVNERYKELNSKILTDEIVENKQVKNNIGNQSKTIIDLSPLSESINQLNQNLSMIREEIKENKDEIRLLTKQNTIFTYLIVFNIFLLTALFIFTKK
ncbi:hypothetical protein [Leptospira kanakyensis]|uniref:Tetratricopeptide repeat protein n=1 Tax=Leptospira kanakyensis TaxID=2484968 RepID=A0A6N4QLV6_9LEPT|nr:hypothetical protein [Leptospira kanakyensis]MCW7481604.1 hypothetical protein [Leptospira kanakyensis]TGK53864.1 hypothetical protein EHQ11_05925 [Leptospira kanakyensis]TGK57659.1 hypothetical protein EHQ16_17615 [Leptospira kanakyensis]TGK73369.1 hypothetical protein EHQ18_06000 [Leptospira kanakyensis]